MVELLRLSRVFFDFVTGTLVPFLTDVPDTVPVMIFTWDLGYGWRVRPVDLPWLFGDISIAQLVVTVLIPTILGIRLFKAIWDALPFV